MDDDAKRERDATAKVMGWAAVAGAGCAAFWGAACAYFLVEPDLVRVTGFAAMSAPVGAMLGVIVVLGFRVITGKL
jgi:hypothetical protein